MKVIKMMMNREFLFLVILCIVTFSCKRKCDIIIEKPNNVKPIVWEDYNDAYDVFWNYFKNDCRGAGWPTGKTIKISGKIHLGSRRFVLMSEHEHEHNDIYDHMLIKYDYPAPSIYVFCFFSDELLKEIILKYADFKGKCYIKGEVATSLIGGEEGGDKCCFTVPNIRLYSIDDLYFEGDENDE